MAVRADCRHYVMQTTTGGDKVERCQVDANQHLPFACPDGCLFYEARRVAQQGWQVAPKPPRRPEED